MVSRLIKYIDPEEFKKILKKEKDRKFKMAYVLAFGSGLRISEIVGLKERISRCCKAKIIETRRMSEFSRKKLKIKSCSKCNKELSAKDMIVGKEWKIER